jgi:heat shock protein HslJ
MNSACPHVERVLPIPHFMRNAIVTSLVTFTLVAAVTAGCSNQTSSPTELPATSITPPPSGQSSGSTALTPDQTAGTWKLESIQSAGQAEQIVPDSLAYTLAVADGRVFMKADCNVCNGVGAFTDQTLTVGSQLACTLAACPTGSLDRMFLSILAGDSAAQIDGNQLTLTSSRGALRFRR